MARVVMEMPSCAPDSWKDNVRCALRTNWSRRPPLRRWTRRCCVPVRSSENSAATNSAVPAVSSDEREQAEERHGETHRRPHRTDCRAGCPAGYWKARRQPGSLGGAGVPSGIPSPLDLRGLPRVPVARVPLCQVGAGRHRRRNRSHGNCPDRACGSHQPVGSGCPSANPAADCTPSMTLSCSSGSVVAPT